MARKLQQIAPGLALIQAQPLWRGDERIYSFLHETSGAMLCCGPQWRFKRAVVDLALPHLARMDWTRLNPDDPESYEVYKNTFIRIIRDSIALARGEGLC